MMKENLLLKGGDLLTAVLDAVSDRKISRITIADKEQKEIMTVPVTAASDGGLLPPLLTVIDSLGALHKDCYLVLEKLPDPGGAKKYDAMDVFKHEAPEVASAFDGLIQSIIGTHGLDAKTKQLIYIAMKASKGDREALKFHIPMAKQLGATKAEVVDAILLTLTVSGITGVASCLPEAVEYFETETVS